MDYTKIDSVKITDQFLTDNAVQADVLALGCSIEVAKTVYLQEILELAGKPPDSRLQDIADAAELQKIDANTKSSDRASRITTGLSDSALVNARRAQLEEWIPAWESEHAQHGILIDLAESPEQVESSTVAQLMIEGAHAAAVEELSKLKLDSKLKS